MGLHQTKKLLYSKSSSQSNEKATYGMGKIFANCVSDKGLIPKIYKELLYRHQQKKKNKTITK